MSDKEISNSNDNVNENRHKEALERMNLAIKWIIKTQGELPELVHDRAEAICKISKELTGKTFSRKTLYKTEFKKLWHPRYQNSNNTGVFNLKEVESNNLELLKRNLELTNQNLELTKQNKEIKNQSSELTKQNKEIKNQSSELLKLNEEIRNQSSELLKLNSELENQNEKLLKQNEELENQNEKLMKQNEEIRKNNLELSK